jgi:lysophospholipase L1-like esterase
MIAQGSRVVLIGDSHMEALGPRLQRLMPERLDVQVVGVEARRGWSTRRYLQSGDLPRLRGDADVAVVELGGNDAAARIGPDAHATDVRRVMDVLAPARVIWVGPGVTTRADLESYRGPIRHAQKRTVEERGGSWIDSQPLTAEGKLARDGVHFTASGYTEWANALLGELHTPRSGSSSGGDYRWVAGVAAAGAAGLFALGAFLWSRK